MQTHRPHPTPNPYVCACVNLRAATRVVTRLYDEALRPVGILVSQLPILTVVNEFGSLTIGELADKLMMDRSTLSRNLKPLEKRGLVSILPGQDRRSREVTLTPAGYDILVRSYLPWEDAQAKVVGILGDQGLDSLLTDLSKLFKN